MITGEKFRDVERRGNIDYLLRTTQQHHVQLSLMADNKAHILIGASLIVLTLVLKQVADHGVQPETAVLALCAFCAAVFAFIAVFPATVYRKRASVTVGDAKFNPLFFGHFAQIDEDAYSDYMAHMLSQDDTAYEAMVRDIYQMGVVLKRTKFRFITYSYSIFITGLGAAFIIFLLRHTSGS